LEGVALGLPDVDELELLLGLDDGVVDEVAAVAVDVAA